MSGTVNYRATALLSCNYLQWLQGALDTVWLFTHWLSETACELFDPIPRSHVTCMQAKPHPPSNTHRLHTISGSSLQHGHHTALALLANTCWYFAKGWVLAHNNASGRLLIVLNTQLSTLAMSATFSLKLLVLLYSSLSVALFTVRSRHQRWGRTMRWQAACRQCVRTSFGL